VGRYPGGGLAGARLWSCDQNAFQESALVKEPPVDDVWLPKRVVTLVRDGLRHRRVAVWPGRDIGWKVR
jgi:hypothetical protein